MSRPRHWSYRGEKVRLAVLRRDNYECQIRGPNCERYANTVDHIHPKGWGGSEDPSNLRAACKVCNQHKGARADERFFSSASDSRAPLLNPSPLPVKFTEVRDYSRRSAKGGDGPA